MGSGLGKVEIAFWKRTVWWGWWLAGMKASLMAKFQAQWQAMFCFFLFISFSVLLYWDSKMTFLWASPLSWSSFPDGLSGYPRSQELPYPSLFFVTIASLEFVCHPLPSGIWPPTQQTLFAHLGVWHWGSWHTWGLWGRSRAGKQWRQGRDGVKEVVAC
jgi:hypothetical protein